MNPLFPILVTIEIKLKSQEDAAECARAWIETERHLRDGNGVSGFVPVSPKTRVADQIRDARRQLQIVAGLVEPTASEARNAAWDAQIESDSTAGRLDHALAEIPPSLDELFTRRRQRVTTTQDRVDYLNALRSVVAKRCEKNKSGVPILSDYDLLDASPAEIAEALAKITPKS